MKVRIRRELLEYLLELAKNAYPNEFAGFLREKDGIFEEVLIAPNPHTGPRSIFFDTWMLPYDETINMTVHSHPSPALWPSEADLEFFSKFGGVHIIIAWPFTADNVRAYSSDGREIRIEVVD